MLKTLSRAIFSSCSLLAAGYALASCGNNSGATTTKQDGGSAGEAGSSRSEGARSGTDVTDGTAGSPGDIDGRGGIGGDKGNVADGAGGDKGNVAGGAGDALAGAGSGAAGAGGETGAPTDCIDRDGDLYGMGDGCIGADCDDQNPLVNPRMLELADDGEDNDCNGGDLTAEGGPGYYVNGSDPDCSDSPGALGSKAAPYCSIAVAVAHASDATGAGDPVGRALFVAKGTYPVAIGVSKSLRIYGGYTAANWTYDPAANVTILGGADSMKDADGAIAASWLSIDSSSNAVVQGIQVRGGKVAGVALAVEVTSSGRVELYDNVIVAGDGYQNVAVRILGDTGLAAPPLNAWLLKNRVSAGTPTTLSNYGVIAAGSAVLWGNVIDIGQGSPSVHGSVGAAVQNYGAMVLTNNVLNGGDYGGAYQTSYGFMNIDTNAGPFAVPSVAAVAYNNVIFAGRGGDSSVGVENQALLKLINNVIGDRTPGPLTFDQKPDARAIVLSVGSGSQTTLGSNDLYQLTYSDELTAPNADALRALVVAYDGVSTVQLNDLERVNSHWPGNYTGLHGANLAVDPGFVGGGDFHLTPNSPLISQGEFGILEDRDPLGLAGLDIDGQLRSSSEREIGIDER